MPGLLSLFCDVSPVRVVPHVEYKVHQELTQLHHHDEGHAQAQAQGAAHTGQQSVALWSLSCFSFVTGKRS